MGQWIQWWSQLASKKLDDHWDIGILTDGDAKTRCYDWEWWTPTAGNIFFPTCQVRVVRFYLSCLLLLLLSSSSRRPPPLVVLLLSLSSSSRCPPRPLAQLRLAIHSVRCRTSTTTIHAQCSLPDLNHDQPRPVFPAGPQPRPATPSVPCRTSSASIHAKCSLSDLM